MITLNLIDYLELIIGLIFVWVGFYCIYMNLNFKPALLSGILLIGYGFSLYSIPPISHALTQQQYFFWQKINDLPLFFVPIICYHLSLIGATKLRKPNPMLLFGYLVIAALYALDVKTKLIVDPENLRFIMQSLNDFAAGPLLAPSILFVCLYLFLAILNFNNKKDQDSRFAIWGCIVYIVTGLLFIVSYCFSYSVDLVLLVGITTGNVLFVLYIVHKYLSLLGEKKFLKIFSMKTLAILLLLAMILAFFIFLGIGLNFGTFVFLAVVFLILIFSHSFYEWFSTFINDLVYNASSGFSVVTDQEAYQVIRNYNDPEKLEDSSLMRLKIVNKIYQGKETGVDAIRIVAKKAIEYFKPEDELNRRTKRNLKYHLLKMIAYDEAEEGQILWELGFEDYPVAIMKRESRDCKPMLIAKSPADYSYTSRNAFIALKKEAIHDIAWRISYLEKQNKQV